MDKIVCWLLFGGIDGFEYGETITRFLFILELLPEQMRQL